MAGITDFITDYVTWCERKPNGPGRYYVEFTLATNQPDFAEEGGSFGGNVVCYATGTLEFSLEKAKRRTEHSWARFVGGGTQYFSDRTVDSPPTKMYEPAHPFDSTKTEAIGVRIDVLLGSEPCVSVGITLADWGNYEYGFHPDYKAGILYGFSNAIGMNVPAAMYTLSLRRMFQPAPAKTKSIAPRIELSIPQAALRR
jgi:hypothetical protein